MGRIIVITGARQTGKTTLAKQCFPEYTYLSIDDPVLRVEYSKLTAQQWRTTFENAILDEVQKEPRLIESIKSVYDQFQEPRYVLLGSSQLRLLEKVRESLAGRCIILEVFPLTIPEIRSESWENPIQPSMFQQLMMSGSLPEMPPSFYLLPDYARRMNAWQYYLNHGGYPALVNPELTEGDRQTWLLNYIRTYLERDVRDLVAFRSLEPFVKAQQISALRTGQLINYSDFANECGVSPKTAQRFLHYLDLSYQTMLLPPWSRNPLKRLVKSPKLHFLDPGVQKAILRKTGPLSGNEYESAIVAEMFKQTRVLETPVTFYHLRTIDGREVDLIIETESGYYAFEIKLSERITRADTRGLRDLSHMLDKPLLGSFILSNHAETSHPAPDVMGLHAGMFLS